MYLSRLILNPRNRQVRRDLSDCQQMHRTILSAFPRVANQDEGARSQFGLLYRVDINVRSGVVALLVQSHVEPDWNNLPGDYFLETSGDDPNPVCKIIGEKYDGLNEGMRLVFRLRANPTRRVSARSSRDEAKWHGKRVELCREEDQLKWLERKAEGFGFKLLSVRAASEVANVRTINEGKTKGWKSLAGEHDHSKARLTFAAVVFEGLLTITDADLFHKALRGGIGSGKAYGFGLLSIAPAR